MDKSYLDSVFTRKLHEGNRLTWSMITRLVNEHDNVLESKDHYKRLYYKWLAKHTEKSIPGKTLDEKILELKKEKVKLSDERVQNNAYIRQLSREETLKEIAHTVAEQIAVAKPLDLDSIELHNSVRFADAGILEISDWHYGMDFQNYWNTYSPEIAKERIEKLYREVVDICTHNEVYDLYVVNLSDLIAGRIHLGLRLESRFDVITQTMEVSEILAEFLAKLAKKFNVHYYDCIDNHSRVEPNKSDAMNLESFARFIPWFLQERLSRVRNITIHENKFGEDIITFKVHGHSILGVHGDKDNVRNIIEKMSTFTEQHHDLILTAHLHHFSADENCNTLVVSNGSLMGTDTYAKNLRLNSKPQQNLIICSTKNPVKAIYRITL